MLGYYLIQYSVWYVQFMLWEKAIQFVLFPTKSADNSYWIPEMSKEGEGESQDRAVEMWKVKKLIKSLQAARG